jgi:hypothetical protein
MNGFYIGNQPPTPAFNVAKYDYDCPAYVIFAKFIDTPAEMVTVRFA